MPAGMLDALKMLPMVSRLRDLMPKTVSDAPCQEVVQARRHRSTSSRSSSAGPRTAAATSRCRWCSRRIPKPARATSAPTACRCSTAQSTGMHWQRHKGGAQHYRVAERLGQRLPVAVALGPDPGAGVLGDGADARRARRADAGGLPAPRARRAGEVRHRRPRGAGERADHPRGLRRARRAPPRRAVRRSHRLLLASRRLSGLPPHVHHAAASGRSI